MAISMLRGVLEDGGRWEHGQPWTKLQKGMAEGEQKVLEFRAEFGGIKVQNPLGLGMGEWELNPTGHI